MHLFISNLYLEGSDASLDSEKGNLKIHAPQQVKNEDMSRRRNMMWTWRLILTTRQQQKHTQKCHPHVMGLIWWHFLITLMVDHDMDSFRGTCSKHLLPCKFSYVYIWKNGTPCLSPFTSPLFWKHQFDLKTPFYMKVAYIYYI